MTDPSKRFDAFAAAVAGAVCWQRGVGSEWDCDCVIDAQMLIDLVRLAFEARAEDRAAFLSSLTQDA